MSGTDSTKCEWPSGGTLIAQLPVHGTDGGRFASDCALRTAAVKGACPVLHLSIVAWYEGESSQWAVADISTFTRQTSFIGI